MDDPFQDLLRNPPPAFDHDTAPPYLYKPQTLPILPAPASATRTAAPETPGASNDDLPPTYTPLDDAATTFALHAPLIYTISSSSHTPRYQLSVLTTKSGKPYQLRIRRLLATESRRLSLARSYSAPGYVESAAHVSPVPPASRGSPVSPGPSRGSIASISGRRDSAVAYDNEGTLYEAKNVSALGGWAGTSVAAGIEIRGCRASTLPGLIRLEKGSSLTAGKWWKFWHLTRNKANDSLREENERKMQKYGYHADEEWNRELLYRAKAGKGEVEWAGGNGRVVAVECGEAFRILGQLDGGMRDLLVACWAARCWSLGEMKWGGAG
ncbi:hypothetical protein W97_03585 [Coniosporium apollinis CBS 100218]|uniref:Uncharacterized protein n=1 Tax=Coniosporium apollinis (strain CBS 100218) TaxID=1168221 RepID=R7YRC0_CONA1|nr:uncharacterized protein W97_03585 [Coniosporium apollinis CBS 100218]EON64354.1 hypothetical protein W97_03585 [Coniosporium apollinis CBS 100218]